MAELLLEVRDFACLRGKDDPIFSGLSFDLHAGDVLVLSGKSGAGKTTLLKCLAHLSLYEGSLLFRGKPPSEYGIPSYRTKVFYVPQRTSLLPGTPRTFLKTVNSYAARRKQKKEFDAGGREAVDVSEQWGIEEELWDREWATLSGGEAQRIALAIAVGMKGWEILLLDEPTSALDAESSHQVEKHLLSLPKDEKRAMVWITHSEEQAERVATRRLRLNNGAMDSEEDMADHV